MQPFCGLNFYLHRRVPHSLSDNNAIVLTCDVQFVLNCLTQGRDITVRVVFLTAHTVGQCEPLTAEGSKLLLSSDLFRRNSCPLRWVRTRGRDLSSLSHACDLGGHAEAVQVHVDGVHHMRVHFTVSDTKRTRSRLDLGQFGMNLSHPLVCSDTDVLTSYRCTWEILKDNFHHCPNCKIDLKKHCGDAYGTDEKLEVQRKFSATPTPEKQLKSRSATERNQPKTRPKTRKKRKKKRRVIHRKKSLSLNHAESGSVMASSYFTLPSPRGSHTRARKSSGRRIRVTKISPILKDLEKLNLPRRRELTTTGV